MKDTHAPSLSRAPRATAGGRFAAAEQALRAAGFAYEIECPGADGDCTCHELPVAA